MRRARVLSNDQLFRAILIVLFGFVTSGVLGLIRIAIVSAAFGTTEAADAFTAAQRLPEAIFALVAGGALGSSFIPVYARLREQDTDAGWRLASATLTLSAMAATILGLFVILLAEPIVTHLVLSGRSPETQTLTIQLMRIMMVTPVIFSISGLVMGILQSHGLFLLASIAVSMNSVGIIIGTLVIAPLLPAAEGLAQVGDRNIYGLALGTVLSALLHLLVQIPDLWRLRAPLRFLPSWRITGVVDVIRLMIPRSLGLGVVQINYIVNLALASGMASGAIAALNTAFMLMFFALGIIGQSVGSAVFPTLAALYAQDDLENFKEKLVLALRGVLFLALPAMVIFVVGGDAGVSVLERGQWTNTSTQATAWALAFYAVGLPGFVLLEVLSRAFYAIEDTWTPVTIGVGAMIANIILSLLLAQVIGDPESATQGAFGGLALANALATTVEALLLWAILRRRLGPMGLRRVAGMVVKVAIACVPLALGISGAMRLTGSRSFGALFVGGLVGGGLFFIVALVLRVEEAQLVPAALWRRFRR